MVDFYTNREVLVGKDTVLEIPSILKKSGKKNVFLSVYQAEAPCIKAIRAGLEEMGISYVIRGKVYGKEPDIHDIDQGTAICVQEGCDAVVAVGGGSVIDAAKMVAMMATNGGCTEDYQLNGRMATKEPLLFIAVPTTAGTGAEVTKVSVIFNPNKGYKKAAYDPCMIASVAVLDPMTTIDLPAKVTAATGMDAITHAIESYTSLNANTISKMYSLKALEILAANIEKAYHEPTNLQARENMLLGSYFAGMAISVGTCLAHIVGQPFGAIYGIPHGDVCSIFLIPSMRMNKDYCLPQYLDIAKTLGVDTNGKSDDQAFEELIAILEGITAHINAPRKVTHYTPRENIDVDYAVENIATSMAHIKNNPRPVSREVFRELLLAAL